MQMARMDIGNGPVRVVMAGGEWQGKYKRCKGLRPELHEPPPDGPERPEQRAWTPFRTVEGECEVCGAAFTGPPNRRRCDRHGKR